MRRLRLLSTALAVGAFSVGLAACGDDDDDGGSSGGGGEATLDLTIGSLLPLTGDLQDFGGSGEKASQLAISEIEAAIEEVGADHTVKLQVEDDQTTEEGGISAAQALAQADASCVAGAYASGVTIPVSESVTVDEEILQISPASTSDEITGLEDDGFLNRTAPPDSFQGPTLANFIEEELGGAEGKVVNIGARNDPYGTGLAETFTAAWEEKGGEIGEEVIYDPEAATYDSEAGDIVSGDPDAFVIIDFPETYAKVGPALAGTGDFDPTKAFVTDGLISGTLAEDAGDDAVVGLRGTAPGAPDEGEASSAFDEAYTSAEPANVDRNTFDAQTFDAVVLCYLAAVAAGSDEGADMAETVREVSAAPGDQYSFTDLAGAIEALQNGDDIDYEGASGSIEMDDAGDATAGVYDTYEFNEKGVPDVIGEVPVETGE
ncbi:MAG: ABC transporter substrate-binding protein [Actinomycetota bacterium]|nr:ABC transporter substrate-binding protein [Actinomycetota bacterium]